MHSAATSSGTGDEMTSGEPSGSATAASPGRSAGRPWYERPLAFYGAVLGIYVAARVFSGIVLYLVGLHQVDVVWFSGEKGYLRMTVLWDAFWYRQIVEDGYPSVLPHDPDTGKLWQNPWAFYPMFPMLTRFVMHLTGLGFALVGSTISLVFGGVAAALVAVIVRDRVGPRVALAVVAVWATMITSSMLQVAYTESVAMTLLCGVLLALTRGRWWIAAGVAVLTGLARPIAIPLGIVALVSVYQRWRRRRSEPIGRREGLGMLAALGACGLSGGIWPLIVWRGTGVFKGYTETMTAWRAYDEIQPFVPWWETAKNVMHSPAGAAIGLLAVIVATLSIAAGPWARALGPQLRAWCLAYPLYLFTFMDPTTSIFRYLIELFPWAIVMVGAGRGRPGHDPVVDGPRERPQGGAHAAFPTRAHAGVRSSRLWTLTIVWVVIGCITQCWWIWDIWQFTPPADNPP